MALTNRQVHVILTDDDAQKHLMTMPAHAEWMSTCATVSGGSGATTVAAEAGKSHVLLNAYVSNDLATVAHSTLGGTLLNINGVKVYCHNTTVVPLNWRLATNTAAVATVTVGAGVVAAAALSGYTIVE